MSLQVDEREAIALHVHKAIDFARFKGRKRQTKSLLVASNMLTLLIHVSDEDNNESEAACF
jgi:hypothetical protein